MSLLLHVKGCGENYLICSKRNDGCSPKQFSNPQSSTCENVSRHARTSIVENQYFSPEIAPCDFVLYTIIKNALKRTRYETVDAAKEKVVGGDEKAFKK
ncbi:hypothetical protein AVEN_47683-1 [Araneus ventricosus]|uniref:Uncharacterized protein n=1 Tax=Araneus ventricosus TaxID=182803 RepID=A0A4Y2MX06_ARAVE|nr:hypothetical protein AVEN_47683-1 [Araneus ventricosus]